MSDLTLRARKRPERALPAAVETDQAAPVARVVPKSAKIVRMGNVVAGYFAKPARVAVSQHRAFATMRLSAIETLILDRHGGPVDTDDGEAYFIAALPTILTLEGTDGRESPVAWCAKWTPRLLVEKDRDWFRAVARRFTDSPRGYRADTIARMLGVRDEERRRLGLRTFGAVDVTAEMRAKSRKAAARERMAHRRRAIEKRTPREEYEARSTTALEPWKALGISRRTYYRRLEKARAEASGGDGTGLCAPLENISHAANTPVPPVETSADASRRDATPRPQARRGGASRRRLDEHETVETTPHTHKGAQRPASAEGASTPANSPDATRLSSPSHGLPRGGFAAGLRAFGPSARGSAPHTPRTSDEVKP